MKISKSIYMGCSNGQLETSSGTGRGEKGEPGLPGIGFNLTDDGDFDLDSKRLTDVGDNNNNNLLIYIAHIYIH